MTSPSVRTMMDRPILLLEMAAMAACVVLSCRGTMGTTGSEPFTSSMAMYSVYPCIHMTTDSAEYGWIVLLVHPIPRFNLQHECADSGHRGRWCK